MTSLKKYAYNGYMDKQRKTMNQTVINKNNHIFEVLCEKIASNQPLMDQHGNLVAEEGCDRCECGSKYWENDTCIDCGNSVLSDNVLLSKDSE